MNTKKSLVPLQRQSPNPPRLTKVQECMLIFLNPWTIYRQRSKDGRPLTETHAQTRPTLNSRDCFLATIKLREQLKIFFSFFFSAKTTECRHQAGRSGLLQGILDTDIRAGYRVCSHLACQSPQIDKGKRILEMPRKINNPNLQNGLKLMSIVKMLIITFQTDR